MVFVHIGINAQVFNHKIIMDKFDDVTVDKYQKTLIQQTDSTFIIEEKGDTPITYFIANYAEYNSAGRQDSIVNLVGNIYGYQECWSVILETDLAQYKETYINCILESDENKRNEMITKMINDYSYYITHRVVTTQYTHDFVSEYYWVQKGDTNGRTIYSNLE